MRARSQASFGIPTAATAYGSSRFSLAGDILRIAPPKRDMVLVLVVHLALAVT